ncbi:unnamed protein product [Orchesella dallaii]|uniref:Uncharacterized protein n=1 Tax=Orchesella dallaii TaxID=48710 RepID=A0ABP1RA49_9HEXA
MALLKQFMTARESSHLLCKTRLDVRLLHENITDEFLGFTNQEIKWIDCATEICEREMVQPDLDKKSFLIIEEWKLVRDTYAAVKKKEEDFQRRLNGAMAEFKGKEKQLSDPGEVDQFGFCQTMTTKQRKKYLKVCISNENILRGEMTKFQKLKEKWEAIKVDMVCSIEQFEKAKNKKL